VSNIGEIGKAFVQSAAEVKAQGSQFEQTFKDMQDAAHTAINGVAKDSGILETRLETLGSQIYAFARSSGGDANESLELMKKALQAAADGAAYYDRSLEDTTASLQSFLKGNYENDAALGLSATEATRNAEAYELFGKKFNDLTEIQKQQTLLQMVLDAQELSGAMGQAARESEGWENVQGNLNESIRQFQAAAGEPFLAEMVPIVQKLTSVITDLTQNTDWESFNNGVRELVNSVKEEGLMGLLDTATDMGVQFVNNITEGLASNISTLLDQGLPMLLQFTENLRTNAGKLVDAGLEFILQITQGFINSWPTFFQTVPEMISNIAGLINDNAPKLLVAAGELILMMLQGLWDTFPDIIAAIPDMIQAMVDVFMAYNWIDLGKNIITFLKDGITAMASAVKTSATSIKDNIVNVISQLPAKLKTLGTDGINSLINAIKGLLGTVKSTATSLLNGNIIDVLKVLPTKLSDLGKNAINKLISAIKGLLSSVKSTATSVLNNVVNGVKDMPTKLSKLAKDAISKMKENFKNTNWKDLGKNIVTGIVNGVSNAASKLINKLKELAKQALNAAKKALGIKSPSRKFRDIIGKMIPAGITEGLNEEFPDTIGFLKKQTQKMLDTASNLVPNVMEYTMPVMATGTILPANAGVQTYGEYMTLLGEELKGLKNFLMQRENPTESNNNYQFVAQINRRTLFEEFMEEAKLRSRQTGKNVFEF
jgi:molecular chaperone GrpE (heat shock protein)